MPVSNFISLEMAHVGLYHDVFVLNYPASEGLEL